MTAPFFTLSLAVEGDVIVVSKLASLEERARDLRPAWPAVVEAFQLAVTRAFESEGSSTAFGRWAPLAPATIKQRQRLGFGTGPILQRTQTLRRALTLGVGAYVRSQPNRMEYQLSEDVFYFRFHQSTAPRKRLPRRPPVSLTERDRASIVNPVKLYILTGNAYGGL